MQKNTKKLSLVLFGVCSLLSFSNYVAACDALDPKKYEKVGGEVDSKDVPWKDFPSPTLLLPVNVLGRAKSRVNLRVAVPENFQFGDSQEGAQMQMLEFIPKTDKDINSWSEIITTFVKVGHRAKASKEVEFVKDRIKQGGLKPKLLESDNKNCGNYSESSFLMSYGNGGRREVIFAKYCSGPFDCSGFQYTIALNKGMTEEQAKQKIKEFVQKNTDVVKF